LKDTCDGLKEKKDPWKKNTQKFYTNPKEKFAEALIRRNEPLSTLKSEIERYTGIQDEITASKSTDKEKCIQLDNTIIKEQIINILISWQNTVLLKTQEHVILELDRLYTLFRTTAETLNPTPQDLVQLNKAIEHHKNLTAQKPVLQAQIGPLIEKFDYLKDHVNFKDEDDDKKKNLEGEWENFNRMLDRIKLRNDKKYGEMHADTLRNLDEFGKESEEAKRLFI
jgi:dynein heavy chain